MAAENICPNCGASNDPVFASCLFCNTPLIKAELSTLSTETIIENCGLWIGRLSGADPEGVELKKDQNNHVVQKISIEEVKGYVGQYMILLETRAFSNPNLEGVLHRLNDRYGEASKNFQKNTKNYWLIMISCAIFIVGVSILMLWANNMGWLKINK
jgi:hypothetical protein